MKTVIPTKVDFKLSDIIDGIAENINQLDPDVAGEDDEIYDLEEIRMHLMDAMNKIEEVRNTKYSY